MTNRIALQSFGVVSVLLLLAVGCSSSTSSGEIATAGGATASSSGGAAFGGNSVGGSSTMSGQTGGVAAGGDSASQGGAQTGGTTGVGSTTATGGVAISLGGTGSSGASAATGGATSGGTSPMGGATAAGGTAPTGGKATGGVVSIGGTSSAGGKATGGAVSNGGTSTGGTSTAGGATAGGSASTCWTGATVTWTASDYVSRKWARWPIPNSTASALPHPMSYTTATDGVLDNVTGLIWQKSTSTTGTNWADALAYCTGLGAGWSLPTRIELTTIVRHDASGSKVDTSVFTFGASAGWTWASTPWVVNQRKSLTGDAALSFFINFAVGDTNNSLSQTNTGGRSRCVKIQQTMTLPAEHYTVSNGEVRDNYTCLTWQQAGSGTTPTLTHDQAIAYCQGLTLNGQKWRLPSVNELASIVDDVPTGDVSPAVDHATFPDTSPDQKYWSSSAYGAPASATTFWTMNFMDGFTQHPDASTLGNARCVR